MASPAGSTFTRGTSFASLCQHEQRSMHTQVEYELQGLSLDMYIAIVPSDASGFPWCMLPVERRGSLCHCPQVTWPLSCSCVASLHPFFWRVASLPCVRSMRRSCDKSRPHQLASSRSGRQAGEAYDEQVGWLPVDSCLDRTHPGSYRNDCRAPSAISSHVDTADHHACD